MKLIEENFQTVVKACAIAVAVAIVLNVYLVLRNRELFRDAMRAEARMAAAGQALQQMQGALQEYSARAASDPQLASLLRRLQSPPATETPAGGGK